MDYNNQNPYEQNSGTNPYSQNSGTSPYTPGQDPYGQSSDAQQTAAGQGAYSQGQGTQTQDNAQNPYYQQSPYQQGGYQQSSNQQSAYGQNSYQQPQYQGYQSYQSYQYSGNVEEPMSVKEWLIVDLLMLIPCVNIILVFVWAFSSSEKKSKSNFFKANLIFAGCILAFYLVILFFVIGVGFASAFY